MTDVLERLQRALPQVTKWIDQLLIDHSPTEAPVGRLGFTRLAAWFPASLFSGEQRLRQCFAPRRPR